MERYIGLDVHQASTTMAIIGPSGKKLKELVVDTNGNALVTALQGIAGDKYVSLEEGQQAEWIYEILKPHSKQIVVVQVPERRGQKSDRRDAFALAEMHRKGDIVAVFKDATGLGKLRELSRLYTILTRDVVRTKNRLKIIYRSRGVRTPDATVYSKESRAAWLEKLTTIKKLAAVPLYRELDVQLELKEEIQEALIAESRRHAAAKYLESCPGIGPVRAAQVIAIVVTPHRFRTRRQFWAYCGLGVVMRSSSDWVRDMNSRWVRTQTQVTRGLNLNHNHELKNVFKGAAMTVAAQPKQPLHQDYLRLTTAGAKPPLAQLTIARRIAAIALALWKRGEEYDPTKHRKEDSRLVS